MSMTPKEKYKAHLRYVLNKLELATLSLVDNNDSGTYWFIHPPLGDGELPSREEQGDILDQLRYKLHAIKITGAPPLTNQFDYRKGILFKPIEPAFSKLCKKYRQKKSVQSQVSIEKMPLENGVLTKIICVRPENNGNRFLIVINNDYAKPIQGDKAKPSWDLLFKIAEKEQVSYEGHKQNIDYLNSNERNRIYTQTGLKKTQILKIEDGTIRANIPMEVISEKAYETRKRKMA